MNNQTTLAIVVVLITLAAHYYFARWIRFKMDEGSVLNFLQQNLQTNPSSQQVADAIKLSLKRVEIICQQSGKITKSASSTKGWQQVATK